MESATLEREQEAEADDNRRRKERCAEAMTRLTGGRLEVRWDGGSFRADLSVDLHETCAIDLGDFGEQDICRVLALEARRISRVWQEIANAAAWAIIEGEVGP